MHFIRKKRIQAPGGSVFAEPLLFVGFARGRKNYARRYDRLIAAISEREDAVIKRPRTPFSKLFHLPPKLLFLLSALSAAALSAVFVYGAAAHPLSLIAYLFSACTLAALGASISRINPVAAVKRVLRRLPLGKKYLSDAAFRVRVSLFFSLTFNLAYAAFRFAAGVTYQSIWLGAAAIYHLILFLARFQLLQMLRRLSRFSRADEYRIYRRCGYILSCLHLALAGIVFLMVRQNRGYDYPGLLLFLNAAYTLYLLTLSIVSLVRYRRYHSPVLSAAKAVSFAAALVSMLSLETAILLRFGRDEEIRQRVTLVFGTAVCLAVLSISIYMIVRANRALKKLP